MELDAEWTPDCQGKWSYDAKLVDLSCRYWPESGGFSVFNRASGTWEENSDRPHIPPSANATIYVQGRAVIEEDFTGATEAEVKSKVEAWAQTQFDRIVESIYAEFKA